MKPYFGLHWLMLIARWRFREIQGIEYLPRSGSFILAGNHVGSADPAFIFAEVYSHVRRPITFVAMDLVTRMVGRRTARAWLHLVEKDEAAPDACLADLRRELEAGNPVGIFPEGMRNSAPFVLPGKTGVARLALWSGAPVIPFGFQGPATWSFNQGLRAFLTPRKDMVLRIGAPISFPKTPDEQITKELLIRTTRAIMDPIGLLSNRPSPFPPPA